jgi:hypothetical protein
MGAEDFDYLKCSEPVQISIPLISLSIGIVSYQMSAQNRAGPRFTSEVTFPPDMPGIFAAPTHDKYFAFCVADCGNQIAVVRLVPIHAELRRHPPDS